MAKLKAWIVGPVAGVFLLAGCENIPLYNDSLNWFSWSKHDPEVKAIESDIPPPGELEAQPAPAQRAAFVRDGRGEYAYADPPPGADVTLGATPFVSRGPSGAAGNVSVAAAGNNSVHPSGVSSDPGAPLVGLRSSVSPSVTWRSSRGTAQ